MSALRSILPPVAGLILAFGSASCRDAHTVTAAEQARAAPAHFDGTTTADPSDTWEWMSETVPTYVEMVALDQTPHPDDGVGRVCPNDQLIERNANLRMDHNGEMINFYFRGPFTFMRHVSTT